MNLPRGQFACIVHRVWLRFRMEITAQCVITGPYISVVSNYSLTGNSLDTELGRSFPYIKNAQHLKSGVSKVISENAPNAKYGSTEAQITDELNETKVRQGNHCCRMIYTIYIVYFPQKTLHYDEEKKTG